MYDCPDIVELSCLYKMDRSVVQFNGNIPLWHANLYSSGEHFRLAE